MGRSTKPNPSGDYRTHTPHPTPPTPKTNPQVKSLLEAAVLTERHPRTMIHVVLQALGDDGGVLACALNVRRFVCLVG